MYIGILSNITFYDDNVNFHYVYNKYKCVDDKNVGFFIIIFVCIMHYTNE